METGIHVGAKIKNVNIDKEGIETLGEYILHVLNSSAGDSVKQKAIEAFRDIAHASLASPTEHITISDTAVYGGDNNGTE